VFHALDPALHDYCGATVGSAGVGVVDRHRRQGLHEVVERYGRFPICQTVRPHRRREHGQFLLQCRVPDPGCPLSLAAFQRPDHAQEVQTRDIARTAVLPAGGS
jgi:hypothetical protein